jgi:hypothetical protein
MDMARHIADSLLKDCVDEMIAEVGCSRPAVAHL